MNCLGIPIRYDPKMESISVSIDRSRWWSWLWPWRFERHTGIIETQGIFKWKEIVTGPALRAFPEAEQEAILLHEVGHAKLFHIEGRIPHMWKILFAPSSYAIFCQNQEYQADYFAAECGRGKELARALMRINSNSSGSLHPATADRIARLIAWHSKA